MYDSLFFHICKNKINFMGKFMYMLANESKNKLFFKACLTGNLEIAQWIYRLDPNIQMDNVLSVNNLNIIEWVLSLNNQNIMNVIPAEIYMCAQRGSLEKLKLLFAVNDNITSFYKDNVFYISGINSHINIVEWMLEHNLELRISQFLLKSFCKLSNLTIAKLIAKKFPELLQSNDFKDMFILAFTQKKFDTCKWIQTLYPYKFVINSDMSSYYIRTEQEINWEKRKYYVWLMSHKSPNKESIIYKIPTDVSIYLIKFI